MIPAEAKILKKMREAFAAGFYEDRNAPCCKKFSRAIFRHLESLDTSVIAGRAGTLFPQGEINIWQFPTGKVACFHSHSFSVEINQALFEKKMEQYLDSESDKETANNIKIDFQNRCVSPISHKYRVGGGYTEYFNRLNPKLQEEVIKRTTMGI